MVFSCCFFLFIAGIPPTMFLHYFVYRQQSYLRGIPCTVLFIAEIPFLVLLLLLLEFLIWYSYAKFSFHIVKSTTKRYEYASNF